MSLQYKITYRDINSMCIFTDMMLKKHEPKLCLIKPTIINYKLGNEEGILITDGEYWVDLDTESYLRISTSGEVEPTKQLLNIVGKALFKEYMEDF